MTTIKKILGILLFIALNSVLFAQYKSIDFEINASSYVDDYLDHEYDYEFISTGGLLQISLGYSFSINRKLVLSPRIAYAYALQGYRNTQFFQSGGSLEDRTFIEKNKKISFLKTGIALSYWINKPGKGLYLESEIQNLFMLSAISKESKKIGAEELQEYTVNFENEVKSIVPSVRFGIGFNLPLKNISVFLRFSRELRISTYFKTTDNYTFINRSIGFGFKYILGFMNDLEKKDQI